MSTTPCAQVRREQQGGLRTPHPRRVYAPTLLRPCQEQPAHWQSYHHDPSLMCQGMRKPHHRQGPRNDCRLPQLYIHACCCPALAAHLWDMRSPLPCRTLRCITVNVLLTRSKTVLQDYTPMWPPAEASHYWSCWQKDRPPCTLLCHCCLLLCPGYFDWAAPDVHHHASPLTLGRLWVSNRWESVLIPAYHVLCLSLGCTLHPSPFTQYGLPCLPQVDMLESVFRGWRELTCPRQWKRMCFLAWASLRAPADIPEYLTPVASDINGPAPESRIRITLVLRASPAGFADHQAPVHGTPAPSSDISMTPTSHMESRNVRARYLQGSPTVTTSSTRTGQEPTASVIEDADTSVSLPDQAHALPQLYPILRTSPAMMTHRLALSHSYACRNPYTPSGMACRLDGHSMPTASAPANWP